MPSTLCSQGQNLPLCSGGTLALHTLHLSEPASMQTQVIAAMNDLTRASAQGTPLCMGTRHQRHMRRLQAPQAAHVPDVMASVGTMCSSLQSG